MPSESFKKTINALSAGESPLDLIEIAHPSLIGPIRFVNDLQPITVQGNVFEACAFEAVPPNDEEGVVPQAQLRIANVGREMGQVLEDTKGLVGCSCRLMQVLRSSPDTLEFDITMGLYGLTVDMHWVTGTLGFYNSMDVPAVMVRYTPETAPGVF